MTRRELRARKREVRAASRAEKKRLAYEGRRETETEAGFKRLERRCFWTWPLGHQWQRLTSGWARVCLACGRTETYEWSGYGSEREWVRERRAP